MNRACILGLTALACGAAAAFPEQQPSFVWNVTSSAPTGLYRVLPNRDLRVGDYVLARVPAPYAELFAERIYLPVGAWLLKRLGVLAGSTVCRHRNTITIDGAVAAQALQEDGSGRSLPAWSGCQVLGSDQVFLLAPTVAGSLDSRYFGPVTMQSILGQAVPLWTW